MRDRSGLGICDSASVQQGVDSLIGGATVGLVLVLAFAAIGARPFEGPSEADGDVLDLGDFNVMSLKECPNGGVPTVLEARQDSLVGLGIHTEGGTRQITWGFGCLLGNHLPVIGL